MFKWTNKREPVLKKTNRVAEDLKTFFPSFFFPFFIKSLYNSTIKLTLQMMSILVLTNTNFIYIYFFN